MASLYRLFRPLLFQLPPETAHHVTFAALNAAACFPDFIFPRIPTDHLSKTLMGLTFPNPVGLSAGLDKNGVCINAWDKLGFGFIEVGTVTPKPQPGNPKPRLFRLEQDRALINRLGFNNLGVDALTQRLRSYRGKAILGVNLGKNKDTPIENAADDYLICLHKIAAFADYITINISSPNTPGLRDLQSLDYLKQLLEKIKKAQAQYKNQQKPLPICVKIAPDLDHEQLSGMLETFLDFNVECVIATNTTLARADTLQSNHKHEQGGLSGAPLLLQSNQMLKFIKDIVGNKMTIIGAGGIINAQNAMSKFESGADLLQLYTGLIYEGPKLVRDVLKLCQHKQNICDSKAEKNRKKD